MAGGAEAPRVGANAALLAEVGTNGALTKPDLALLIGKKRTEPSAKPRRAFVNPGAS